MSIIEAMNTVLKAARIGEKAVREGNVSQPPELEMSDEELNSVDEAIELVNTVAPYIYPDQVGGEHNIDSIGHDSYGRYYNLELDADEDTPIEGITIDEEEMTATLHPNPNHKSGTELNLEEGYAEAEDRLIQYNQEEQPEVENLAQLDFGSIFSFPEDDQLYILIDMYSPGEYLSNIWCYATFPDLDYQGMIMDGSGTNDVPTNVQHYGDYVAFHPPQNGPPSQSAQNE